jgi:hypothetical protein
VRARIRIPKRVNRANIGRETTIPGPFSAS